MLGPMAGASRTAWQADAATRWQQGATLAAGPGLEILRGSPPCLKVWRPLHPSLPTDSVLESVSETKDLCGCSRGLEQREHSHVSSTWGFGIPTFSPIQSDPKAQDRIGSGILQEVCGREKWVLLLVDGTRPTFMP